MSIKRSVFGVRPAVLPQVAVDTLVGVRRRTSCWKCLFYVLSYCSRTRDRLPQPQDRTLLPRSEGKNQQCAGISLEKLWVHRCSLGTVCRVRSVLM
jgi:hypothetical protein